MLDGMPDPCWTIGPMEEEEAKIVDYLKSHGICDFWELVHSTVRETGHDRPTILKLISRMSRHGKVVRTKATRTIRLRENYGKNIIRDPKKFFHWKRSPGRNGWQHLPASKEVKETA